MKKIMSSSDTNHRSAYFVKYIVTFPSFEHFLRLFLHIDYTFLLNCFDLKIILSIFAFVNISDWFS